MVAILEARLDKYEKGLSKALGTTNRQFNAIERRGKQMESRLAGIGRGSANALVAPLSGIGAALSVREIANYADSWTEAGNKIRAAAQIAGVQTRSLNELKDGANAARSDLETYVDLYAKLIRSASGVAKSEQEIATATDIVTKAFKAGGASTQEQIAGILQLSQALGSGVLQGDELRSLRENAPLVAKAIADEFGTTVAGLKDLGAEGKLVTDRVFKGILRAQKPIEAAFKATNATIKDAITQVRNEFTAYIGNADASAGASAKLVKALQYLADNFQEVGDVVIQFATLLIGALTGRAIVGVVAGLGNAVVALGGFLTALRAGTVAAAGFTAALGPIGLIAGAASAALFLYGDGMSEAQAASMEAQVAIYKNAEALDAARKSSEGYTAALRNQIAMQLEMVKSAAIANDAAATIATDRALAFRNMTKAMTGTELRFAPLEFDADQKLGEGRALYKQYQLLERQLAEVDKNIKPTGGFGAGGGLSGGGSEKADEYDREKGQIERRIAAIHAETEAQRGLNPLIDDYGFAIEKAAAKQDLLNAAKEAGLIKTAEMSAATPELAAQIDSLSTAYANAVVDAGKLAESQDLVRQRADEMRESNKDVTRGIVDGFLAGKKAADVFADALGNIGNKLLDLAFDSAFDPKTGFLGNIGAAFLSGIPGRAGGGPVRKGQPYVVGERRPELFVPDSNGNIIPRVPDAPKAAPSSGGDRISVNFSPSIDARGADQAAVDRLERGLAKTNAELEARIMKVVRDRPKRGW